MMIVFLPTSFLGKHLHYFGWLTGQLNQQIYGPLPKRRGKHHSHLKVKKGQSTWKKRENIVSAKLVVMEPILTHSFQVLLSPGPSASCLALLLWRKAS